jgi:AraC-like DNA-binding protein
MARRARGTGRVVACVPGLRALEIRCLEERVRWSEAATETAHRVFLVRAGGYLHRVNGTATFVDATTVLVTRPGDEIAVAHPAGTGDYGTRLELSGELVARLVEDGVSLPTGARPLDDRLDLRHRELLAASRAGMDAFEAADGLFGLLDQVGRTAQPPAAVAPRRSTVRAHQRMVNLAKEALHAGGLAVGLEALADAVGCSPHHLSRVFAQVTGERMSAYRNRLRVRYVLSDLQDGADNLRTLAAEYGFADQAHLTRVVRRYLGRSPTEIRRLIAADRA